MTETQYTAHLISKISQLLPGCLILRNDPQYIQGIPDILILYQDRWAMLEVKLSDKEEIRPNQKYYVDFLDEMSFASFITPQNEEEVLYDLQLAFGLIREARIS